MCATATEVTEAQIAILRREMGMNGVDGNTVKPEPREGGARNV